MRSVAWPRMFGTNATLTKDDREATLQNLMTLLHSEKGELVGDPYFGVNLKKYIYDQNATALAAIIIDDIYEQLVLFMPQLTVRRTDITIDQDGINLYCHIKALNNIDYTTNMYDIVLFSITEE